MRKSNLKCEPRPASCEHAQQPARVDKDGRLVRFCGQPARPYFVHGVMRLDLCDRHREQLLDRGWSVDLV